MSDDYYAILELQQNASQEEIKKAYKRMALKWHPDKNADNLAEAENRFKQLGEAYQVLSNPDRRRAYDRSRRSPAGANGRRRASDSAAEDDRDFAANFEFSNPEDVFREFFSSSSSWNGWSDAERAEWETLFSETFTDAGMQQHRFSMSSTSGIADIVASSTVVENDGVNETVTETVTKNGVTTVTRTVKQNGKVVEKTVTGGAKKKALQSGSKKR